MSPPMKRTLCFGTLPTREDCCARVAIKSSYHHPRLYFLNAIWWFSARSPISVPKLPIMALTEFFHADAMASIHPLPISWYLISSLCVYLCSWMHIMSMLWSMADAVSSDSCPILFKFLTLNVTICIVRLHFSNFCLSSVADFLTQGPGPQPQRNYGKMYIFGVFF